MLYSGIEHVAVATADTERLARWYAETLEFTIAWDNGETPRAYLLKSPSGSLVEIIPARRPLAQPPAFKDPGLRHLAIAVPDFDAACEDLRRKQVRFLSGPLTGFGNRVIFFADCDGNILHIIQRGKPL